MRNQNDKVHRSHPTLSGETGRSYIIVVGQIREEKENRNRERREHAGSVRADIVLADEAVSADQQYGAGGVEQGIETRKISDVEHNR